MKRTISAMATASLLSSCAMAPVPVQTASISAVNAIDAAHLPPIRLGSFRLSPALPADRDRSLAVRAATIRPEGGSFSNYLRRTIESQLTAAGRLDTTSDVSDYVLNGEMIANEVGSGIGENAGHGLIAVDFTLTHGGTVTFHKTIRADARWNSSFIGGVAIPAAERNYMALYPEILSKLFADQDLGTALHG